MSTTFDVLAKEDTETKEARSRSITAARVRAQEELGSFLANASTRAEKRARAAVVESDLRKIATEVSTEYGFEDPELVYRVAREFVACACDSDDCDGKGCSCKECHGKESKFEPFEKDEDGDEDEDDEEKEDKMPWEKDSSYSEHKFANVNQAYEGIWHTAADPHWDTGYQHERMTMPDNKVNGLGDTAAVATDRGKAGDVTNNSLAPIDVDSQRHQLEVQDITDRADYNDSDFDPSNPVRERVSPQKAMQPEFTSGPETKTWSGTDGQAAPITNQAFSSVVAKYTLVDLL